MIAQNEKRNGGENLAGASMYYLASCLYEIITTASGKLGYHPRPRQVLLQILLRWQKKNTSFLQIHYKGEGGQWNAGLWTLPRVSWFKILQGLPLAFRIKFKFLRMEEKTLLGSAASILSATGSLPWSSLTLQNHQQMSIVLWSFLAYLHLSSPSGILFVIRNLVHSHSLWEVFLECLPWSLPALDVHPPYSPGSDGCTDCLCGFLVHLPVGWGKGLNSWAGT